MENKKNAKADLQKKSGLFFSIGMVLSLSMVVMAFEWKSPDDGKLVLASDNFGDEIDMIAKVTVMEPPKPKPKPKIMVQPKIVETQEEVPDDIKMVFDPADFEDLPDDIFDGDGFEDEVVDDQIYVGAEQSPAPVGGLPAFYSYVQKNLRYPSRAKRMNVQGKVYVEFVVDKDGSLSDIKILKGIGSGCDEEALRVLKNAPNWKPGKQRGRPVRVRMTVPIIFRLQ